MIRNGAQAPELPLEVRVLREASGIQGSAMSHLPHHRAHALLRGGHSGREAPQARLEQKAHDEGHLNPRREPGAAHVHRPQDPIGMQYAGKYGEVAAGGRTHEVSAGEFQGVKNIHHVSFEDGAQIVLVPVEGVAETRARAIEDQTAQAG
jgi:hypothetical protein